MVITIDGPVAAGKTTVARALARILDIPLLDTGAIYRCVAWHTRKLGIDWTDGVAAATVAAALDVSFGVVEGVQHVCVDGRDVSVEIRQPEISQGASIVSAHPAVRSALLELQRQQARPGHLIAEGRDTGTVVFPQAEHKFFLTAAPDVRAERRYRELVAAGTAADLPSVLAELEERDRRDSSREVAPLMAAPDATTIDSSLLSVKEVLDTIERDIRERERTRPA